MAESIRVSVKPEVFRWLRESSGWSIEDVSKRLGTSVKVVVEIETGTRKPTLHQLKVLSEAYKRPVALFFLSKPKPEPKMPKDYRMLPDKKDVFDKKTILAIRRARSLQDTSRELVENLGESLEPKIERSSIKDDPEEVAYRYRRIFDIVEKKQRDFKNPYVFFNYLRDIMEEKNILVFQISMPIEDARGFVFTDRIPYAIVVNTKDSIEARIFTLMHEFGHILLRNTVVDMPNFDGTGSHQNAVEKWCDTFASRFLLTKEMAENIFEEGNITDTATLNALKRKYKVSKSMIIYNMWKLGFIGIAEYREVINRFKPKREDVGTEDKKKESGAPPIERRRLSEMGEKYVSLVVHNYEKEYITYSEALGYLSVKSKSFDKVATQASK